MHKQLTSGILAVAVAVASGYAIATETAEQMQIRAVKTQAPVRDSPRTFQAFPKNARQLRVEGVVLQERDFSCGAAALSTVLRYQWGGRETETDILRALILTLPQAEMLERIENGLSLTDLRRLAAAFGYQAVLGRLPLEKLRESKIPLIVGITVRGYNHFVVFRGMDDKYVYTADPAMGKMRLPIGEFEKQWQRNAVLVVIKPGADLTKPSGLMATDDEKSLGVVTRRFLQNQVVPRGIR